MPAGAFCDDPWVGEFLSNNPVVPNPTVVQLTDTKGGVISLQSTGETDDYVVYKKASTAVDAMATGSPATGKFYLAMMFGVYSVPTNGAGGFGLSEGGIMVPTAGNKILRIGYDATVSNKFVVQRLEGSPGVNDKFVPLVGASGQVALDTNWHELRLEMTDDNLRYSIDRFTWQNLVLNDFKLSLPSAFFFGHWQVAGTSVLNTPPALFAGLLGAYDANRIGTQCPLPS